MLHHAGKAHSQCVVKTKHITDKVFTISCLDIKGKPHVDCYVDIYVDV